LLQQRDREPLEPGFEQLLQDSRSVAELTEDFLRELQLPITMSEAELLQELARRQGEGQSQRVMARDLRLGRGRIRRLLAKLERARSGPAAPLNLPAPKKRRPSQLDAYEARIKELLARYPQITAVRMHEELRAEGFTGKYTIVREWLRDLRPRGVQAPVERFETGPGRQAQMDWAQYDLDFTQEGRRRVYLFGYVLGYSRRQFLAFSESQDFTTTVREHVRAFEHLGGVPATCLYDNQKVVVACWENDQPVFNTRFLAFATHYGFRPIACRLRRPQTKGKVERPFQYAETNLLNGRTFTSLEHLNEVTRKWLAEVADVRVHRQTGRRPIDMHAEEQPRLIPLPANRYDTAEMVYRSVDVEGFVSYRQNQYSVPWQYVGYVLPLRITDDELIVYGPQLEPLARHAVFPRQVSRERRIVGDHRPDDQDRRRQYELLRQSFDELGPVGERFFEGLLAAHREGKAQARQILALRAHYHQHDLVQALERAMRYGAFSPQSFERILSAQFQPKTALDELAEKEQRRLSQLLKDASVRARPTSDYQKLFFEEKQDGCPPPKDPTAPDAAQQGPAGGDPGAVSDPERAAE
jgi:transposase